MSFKQDQATEEKHIPGFRAFVKREIMSLYNGNRLPLKLTEWLIRGLGLSEA